MSYFLGVHVGRSSLRGVLLSLDGTPVEIIEKRFQDASGLERGLHEAFQAFSERSQWPELEGAAVALDKGQKSSLPLQALQSRLPSEVPLLSLPAQLAILLGAVPSGPSLLVSLGAELRLAATDSTNVYREFRLQEGGGLWWTRELPKLAQHSVRLAKRLAELPSEQALLRALPRLLEYGDYPAPDPVLKVRLDGLCETIAESCLGLASRLPGLRRMSLAGFLHPSPMSRRILEGCADHGGGGRLRALDPRFPAEVGAALLGLSLFKENEERTLLGKPLESGQSAERWGPPPVLLRRLYRLRRPFDAFPTSRARG